VATDCGRRGAGRTVATVRYFVDDVDQAIAFYRDQLGFEEELHPSPTFAMLYRGDLRLLLSLPGEPHALPDGTLPEPGGGTGSHCKSRTWTRPSRR